MWGKVLGGLRVMNCGGEMCDVVGGGCLVVVGVVRDMNCFKWECFWCGGVYCIKNDDL